MANIIELHLLRTLGVSSFNRGENGDVKSCVVGDVLRSRISSQSLKAAIRAAFEETYRTRFLVDKYLIPKCQKENPERTEDMRKLFGLLMDLKTDTKKDLVYTEQIVAYSLSEADAIYQFVKDLSQDDRDDLLQNGKKSKNIEQLKEELKKVVNKTNISLDIAIFGRMSTNGPTYTIPSATHVNHTYSIDEYQCEEDFFTAFDKLADESAMLGTSQFASTTVYSYMNIDPVQVYKNLMLPVEKRNLEKEEYEKVSDKMKQLAVDGVVRVIKLMFQILPSGKQNSMASYPMPSMAYITMDPHTYPCTLDPCFNRIIRSHDDKSVVVSGAERIMNYITQTADKREYRAFLYDSVLSQEIDPEKFNEIDADGILSIKIRNKSEIFDEIRKQAETMIDACR